MAASSGDPNLTVVWTEDCYRERISTRVNWCWQRKGLKKFQIVGYSELPSCDACFFAQVWAEGRDGRVLPAAAAAAAGGRAPRARPAACRIVRPGEAQRAGPVPGELSCPLSPQWMCTCVLDLVYQMQEYGARSGTKLIKGKVSTDWRQPQTHKIPVWRHRTFSRHLPFQMQSPKSPWLPLNICMVLWCISAWFSMRLI